MSIRDRYKCYYEDEIKQHLATQDDGGGAAERQLKLLRDQKKVLAAMDAKEMVSAEDDEAWTSLARRVLQDANDLAVWGWTPPQGASTDFTPSPYGGLGAGSGAGSGAGAGAGGGRAPRVPARCGRARCWDYARALG